MDLGKMIRHGLIDLGWTQSQLADELDRSDSWVSAIVQGRKRAPRHLLEDLLRLGVITAAQVEEAEQQFCKCCGQRLRA